MFTDTQCPSTKTVFGTPHLLHKTTFVGVGERKKGQGTGREFHTVMNKEQHSFNSNLRQKELGTQNGMEGKLRQVLKCYIFPAQKSLDKHIFVPENCQFLALKSHAFSVVAPPHQLPCYV